jgi:hypothetical protein
MLARISAIYKYDVLPFKAQKNAMAYKIVKGLSHEMYRAFGAISGRI